MENNGFYKNEYFEQLNKRLERVEGKIDLLTAKVNYMRGWAMGAGAISGAVFSFIVNFMNK